MSLARWLAGAAIGLTALPAAAQTASPLFSSDAPLTITLQGPIGALIGNRDSDRGRPGTLSVNGASMPVLLSPRGITRRASDICEFPPLRVDLPNGSGPFAGQRSLKLVTHCRRREAHQQFVLMEYAAYRIFNLLTPLSFRARLATITYRDEKGRPLTTRAGFFIEDVGEVARRNGLVRPHTPDLVPSSSLSATEAARVALFQYMIGNLDWSIRGGPAGEGCCHNSRLLQRAGGGPYLPVPYDFDFSGLVDAPYAEPPAQIPVANVRVRKYRGYCLHNPQAVTAAAEFRAKRPQIAALIASIPGLEAKTLQKANAFLDQFWNRIATDSSLQAQVLKECV